MSLHRYLSWDCANRTLAYTHWTINVGVIDQLRAWWAKKPTVRTPGIQADVDQITEWINEGLEITHGFINVIGYEVIDVLNGRKVADTTEVERAIALRRCLTARDVLFGDDEHALPPLTAVLIERQPASVHTHGASHVAAQLMYHFAEHNPVTVAPTLKNSMTFSPSSDAKTLTGRAAYSARKKHSINNVAVLQGCGLLTGLDIMKIHTATRDDIADTIMQGVVWVGRLMRSSRRSTRGTRRA